MLNVAHFDETGCTIHVGIYYIVPVLGTDLVLNINPRVRACRRHLDKLNSFSQMCIFLVHII